MHTPLLRTPITFHCVSLFPQTWQSASALFTSTKSGYDASQAEGFDFGNRLSDFLEVHPTSPHWDSVPRIEV
jgi:hypothetical protein